MDMSPILSKQLGSKHHKTPNSLEVNLASVDIYNYKFRFLVKDSPIVFNVGLSVNEEAGIVIWKVMSIR